MTAGKTKKQNGNKTDIRKEMVRKWKRKEKKQRLGLNGLSVCVNQNLPSHFRKHCQLVLQSSDRNLIFSFGSVYLWCHWLGHPKSSPSFRRSILMPIPLFGTLYFLVHFSSFGSYHRRFPSRQLYRAFALVRWHDVPSMLIPFAK